MTNHHSGPSAAEEIYPILPVFVDLSTDEVTGPESPALFSADDLDRLDLQGRGRPPRANPQRRTRGPRDSREYLKLRPDGHGDVRSLRRRQAGRCG